MVRQYGVAESVYVGEELPDDFVCPLCKHPASDFEKVIKKAEVRKDVKYVI